MQRRLSTIGRALAMTSGGAPSGRAQAQPMARVSLVQVEVSEAGPRGRGALAGMVVAVAVESRGRERRRVVALPEATPSGSGRCQCSPIGRIQRTAAGAKPRSAPASSGFRASRRGT